MTLIASTFNKGNLIIIGDILTSSQNRKEEIYLPANIIKVSEKIADNPLYPNSVFRKIYVLSENLTVALAGSLSQMTTFLAELRMRLKYYDPITPTEISKFIKDFDVENQFNESAYLIILSAVDIDHNISTEIFWFPNEQWQRTDLPNFGRVVCCGSGGNRYLEQLKQSNIYFASSHEESISRAIAQNASFIAQILAAEKFNFFTLIDNWGGAFELIYMLQGKFVSLENIGYVIFQIENKSKGKFEVFPKMIMYQEYQGELLIIDSIRVPDQLYENNKKIGSFTFIDYSRDTFVVPPIDMKDDADLQKFEVKKQFKTTHLAISYSFVVASNEVITSSVYSYGEEDYLRIKENGELEIKFSADFHNFLTKSIVDQMT